MKILPILLLVLCLLGDAHKIEGAPRKTVGDYLPTEQMANQTERYSGNVKTRKYHNDGCKFYDCRDCTKYFRTREAAQKAGYEACWKCGG